jgi:hypothetical protein
MNDMPTPPRLHEEAPDFVSPDKPVVSESLRPQTPAPAAPALDPTRYGDWEKNGRCIDF